MTLLLWGVFGGSSTALPALGAGAAPIGTDMTLAEVVSALSTGTPPFDTGTTFAGDPATLVFDASGYDPLVLAGSGSWVFADDAFTLIAPGSLPGTGVVDTVLVHAQLVGGAPALMVALTLHGGTVVDALPLLGGTFVADLSAGRFGVIAYQALGPIDTSLLPGDSGDFLADVLGADAVPPVVPEPDDEATDEENEAALAEALAHPFLFAAVDHGPAWNAAVELTGADNQSGMWLSGIVADGLGAFFDHHDAANRSLDDIRVLAMAVEAEGATPTFEPAASWLSEPAGGLDPIAFGFSYDQSNRRLEISGSGPTWLLNVPLIFTDASFTPGFSTVQNLVAPDALVIGLEGVVGDWMPLGPDGPPIEVGLTLKKSGDVAIVDVWGSLAIDDERTIDVDIFTLFDDLEVGVTVQLDVPEFSVGDLATLFDISVPPTAPNALMGITVGPTRLIIEIANDGGVALGATGRVELNPFGDSDVAAGLSLMLFADFDSPGRFMLGVAPSGRRVSGPRPDDGGEGSPTDGPVMLSELLGFEGSGFDLTIYDPDDPTLGLGLVYSSGESRIGGDPCLISVGAGQTCPAAQERTDVPANVAQWLMPLWGFDGSDDALDDSTSGSCLICSFRTDYAPATAFTVSDGLTAAGSLVMPHPIGTDQAAAGVACGTDPKSTACTDALGLLGSLALESRAQVSGTLPFAGGASFDLSVTVGLWADAPVEVPLWLRDGHASFHVGVSDAAIRLNLDADLVVAVKQGFSPDEAEAVFGADSAAAATNTLHPAAGVCPRNGLGIVERDSSAGFVGGETYCHDLLRIGLDAQVVAGTDGFSVEFTGDMTAVTEAEGPGGRSYSPNPAGWSPLGFDKLGVNDLKAHVAITARSTGGTSFSVGIALSGIVNTSSPIPFSGAVSVAFTPTGVVPEGVRLSVAQVSLHSIVEIYEWISGDEVAKDDLPGISLRNLAVNIGVQAVPAICIEQGFRLSGDLYVSETVDESATFGGFACVSDPNNPAVGLLSPAPAAECDEADIAAGCVAGIRLVINEAGLYGDAFLAAFDAGPVHIFAPSTEADNSGGRGVSFHLEVNSSGVLAHIYGGASLGGTFDPSACDTGPFCDAWASGEFNVKLRAGLDGVDLRAYGRVTSGLPFLGFQMLAAGRVTLPGASDLVKIFTEGTFPDSVDFALHVELANREAAPDLDFAGAIGDEVNEGFEKVLQGLADAEEIVSALQSDPGRALLLLEEYDASPAIENLVTLVGGLLQAAGDNDLNASFDFLLNGFYAGLPGIPNLGDLFFGRTPPRCDGLNYGYGPGGNRTSFDEGKNFYPYNYCFLHEPIEFKGICFEFGLSPCSLATLAEKVIVQPILAVVLAGIDATESVVEFGQQVTNLVLDGELFRVDCASFDWTRGMVGGRDLTGVGFQETIQLGLFVTLFGHPIGLSFEWDFDSTNVGDVFVKNATSLAGSIIEAFEGTTESTCWTPAQFDEFFADEAPPEGTTPVVPPKPAKIVKVAFGDGVVDEGEAADLVVTYDKAVLADRALAITWGDGSTQGVTVAAGTSSLSVTHTYADDAPSARAVDTATISVVDGAQTVPLPVTVRNVAPAVVSASVAPGSVSEGGVATLEVTLSDPGELDTHTVTVKWDDPGSPTSTVALGAGTLSATLTHTYVQNPIEEVAKVVVTVRDKDGGVAGTTLDLAVLNVAPAISSVSPLTAAEGTPRDYVIAWSDPGVVDRHTIGITWDARGVPAGAPPDEVWYVTGRRVIVTVPGQSEPVRDFTVPGAGPLRSVTVPHTYDDDDPTASPVDAYDVRVTILDTPDFDLSTATYQVDVANLAPVIGTLALSTSSHTENATSVTAKLQFSDASVVDSHTVTIDWGDGWSTGESADATVDDEDARTTVVAVPAPGAGGSPVRTLSATNRYGDDGTFVITVSIVDDDTGTATASVTLLVLSVDPSHAINRSAADGAILTPGGPTFFAGSGQDLALSDTATDPGSDDLTFTWDFGDGSGATNTHLAANPAPGVGDASPSPQVGPRTVTDAVVHSYAQACLYGVTVGVVDDDGGDGGPDQVAVVVQRTRAPGDKTQRNHGQWADAIRTGELSAAQLACYLDIAGYLSRVFLGSSELGGAPWAPATGIVDATVLDGAGIPAVLTANPGGGGRSKLEREQVKLDQALLSAWMTFADGAWTWNTLVEDSNGDHMLDTTFASLIAQVEAVRLTATDDKVVQDAWQRVWRLACSGSECG